MKLQKKLVVELQEYYSSSDISYVLIQLLRTTWFFLESWHSTLYADINYVYVASKIQKIWANESRRKNAAILSSAI